MSMSNGGMVANNCNLVALTVLYILMFRSYVEDKKTEDSNFSYQSFQLNISNHGLNITHAVD